MATVHARTDNVGNHEDLMTAGLEMACASVTRYADLPPTGRRELLTVWADFCQNLAALGVARPLDPKGL